MDRITDAVLLGGVAYYLTAHHHGQLVLLPFAILTTTFMISYQRSKAESLGLAAKGGLMERAERMILLGVGLLAKPIFIPVLWVMLALTAMTAIGTFLARVADRGEPRAADDPARTDPSPQPRTASRAQPHLSPLAVAAKVRVALFKSMGALMEALPERVDVGVASAVASAFGRRSKKARAHLARNLAHALRPVGGDVDQGVLDRFTERAFASYGQYWAEGAKLPGLEPAKVFARFRIGEGLEHLDAAKEKGLGTVIALPHIGSWEWGGSFLNSLGLRHDRRRRRPRAARAVRVVQAEARVDRHPHRAARRARRHGAACRP